MKSLLRKVLTSRPINPLWSPLMRSRVCIFTLHRFALPDLEVRGHSPELLRRTLERLRRDRYDLVSLEEAIDRLRTRASSPRPTVAFTIDDGYADIAQVAVEVFSAFDCPVTVFLSTGFIDGRLWHWWDQVEHVCLATPRTELSCTLGGTSLSFGLRSTRERHQAARILWERCKRVPEQEKQEFISHFADAAEVPIPCDAPARYTALSWSEVLALEGRGFSFAPHGVSHPVLAQTTNEESARQIEESWDTVRRQVERPVPIFAYPNGSADDFGVREIEHVSRCQLAAAVTTIPRYASRKDFVDSPRGPYEVPRLPYPEDPITVSFLASGLDRIARHVRRRRAIFKPAPKANRARGQILPVA